ncbi:filamin A-interacting protein 1-like isoform X2 [Penaeus vannamei]|uniref:filamin A-interacting protein 1-like isoform X2 n=1 Tax=Penaeus vannamei TaxID=6689 RepID=UPI000F66CE84|nr:girdin-like isoform X2 [Penaeus vannamei]
MNCTTKKRQVKAAVTRQNELQATLEKQRAMTSELNAELHSLRGKDLEEKEREKFHLETVKELNQQLKAHKTQLDSIRALTASNREHITHEVSEYECKSRDLVRSFQSLQLLDKDEEAPAEILTEEYAKELQEVIELEKLAENLSRTPGLDLPFDYLRDLLREVNVKIGHTEEENKSLQEEMSGHQETYQKLQDA